MHRGVHLVAHKQSVNGRTIYAAPIPDTLAPSMKIEGPIERSVSDGQSILLGQLLAKSGSHCLLAPVSGRVTALNESNSELRVVIANDGRDAPHPSVHAIKDYRALSAEQLCNRIEAAGIVGLGGARYSTARKLRVAREHRTTLLIVNGVECEPYITCDDALMRNHAADVIFGAQVLLHASEANEALIAIESDKPEAATAVAEALRNADDARIQIRIVGSIYPAGGERQLVQTIANREVPSGGVPADVDVLCQNVGTAAGLARLIATGIPLIERIVTVAGHGIKEQRNLRARFGTPCSVLISTCGGYAGQPTKLIVGGTMMGVAQQDDEITVGAQTNCVLAATDQDSALRRPEMPCIRCGDCAEVCPAGLLPQQLYRYAQNDDRVALRELGVLDCIECGCCDFVCPSHIRLTATFDAAKRAL